MAAYFSGARLKELFARYGRVALGVHMSVSLVSISSFYVAIKNNVDVAELLEKIGVPAQYYRQEQDALGELARAEKKSEEKSWEVVMLGDGGEGGDLRKDGNSVKEKIRSNSVLLGGGGALALAIVCNKALLPVRVPITVLLTPPISRFLARKSIYKGI
ncbi:hypothetical protein O6H91_11G107300 [Diphasiastrum complanatum]|uniref:Uncharacterized protein n=1 Tax=Diphasiastrum complanatum TaxID=34168 RepID=A0ACC2CD12_DIPCM|nr:hypothetical protein O6H91_Y529400 [Diphasiastrum complanatum]KAJ7539739.1 hypothetical protein O6H91_11G107300 [Diphasiastrum complanatum]